MGTLAKFEAFILAWFYAHPVLNSAEYSCTVMVLGYPLIMNALFSVTERIYPFCVYWIIILPAFGFVFVTWQDNTLLQHERRCVLTNIYVKFFLALAETIHWYWVTTMRTCHGLSALSERPWVARLWRRRVTAIPAWSTSYDNSKWVDVELMEKGLSKGLHI